MVSGTPRIMQHRFLELLVKCNANNSALYIKKGSLRGNVVVAMLVFVFVKKKKGWLERLVSYCGEYCIAHYRVDACLAYLF
jgi:hypothetical protein